MPVFAVTVTVDMDVTIAQVEAASERIKPKLADRMATDTNAFIPMRTGLLRSDVSIDDGKIRYNAQNTSGKYYSKYVYYGKKYKHSVGGRMWGDASKSANLKKWTDFTQKAYEEELR